MRQKRVDVTLHMSPHDDPYSVASFHDTVDPSAQADRWWGTLALIAAYL
jgi:hypothetical protein